MSENFWTEENKIMTLDSLTRADLRMKLLHMGGQIVCGKDIVDNCYNYDFVISNPRRAIQFVADYADSWVKSLNKYYTKTGKLFQGVTDPRKVVNLMMLYSGQEQVEKCDFIRKNWDEKIVFNTDNLNILAMELSALDSEKNKLAEKTLMTRTNLHVAALDYLSKELQRLNGKVSKLNDCIMEMRAPAMDEKTAKSLLLCNYPTVSKIVLENEIVSDDLKTMMSHVVYTKATDILLEDFEINRKIVSLDKNVIKYLEEKLDREGRNTVPFRPDMNNNSREMKLLDQKVREAEREEIVRCK